MSKKIVKTAACVALGLGFASSIPFYSTSCSKKINTEFIINDVNSLRNYNFNSWNGQMGLKKKDYTKGIDKYGEDMAPYLYISNILNDLKNDNVGFHNFINYMLTGYVIGTIFPEIIAEKEDERITREKVYDAFTPDVFQEFQLKIETSNDVRWSSYIVYQGIKDAYIPIPIFSASFSVFYKMVYDSKTTINYYGFNLYHNVMMIMPSYSKTKDFTLSFGLSNRYMEEWKYDQRTGDFEYSTKIKDIYIFEPYLPNAINAFSGSTFLDIKN